MTVYLHTHARAHATGAGFQSQKKLPKYKLLCERACQKAIVCLNELQTAGMAAVEALKILEVKNSSILESVSAADSFVNGSSSIFGSEIGSEKYDYLQRLLLIPTLRDAIWKICLKLKE